MLLPAPRATEPIADLTCEAGVRIKPGAQAPGIRENNWREPARAGESAPRPPRAVVTNSPRELPPMSTYIRPLLIFAVCLGLLVLASASLPVRSDAKRQTPQETRSRKRQRQQAFVPGEVLVRY